MNSLMYSKLLRWTFFILIFLVASSVSTVVAQDYPEKINCPQIPMKGKFDTLCYFYLDEIQLGQGTVEGINAGSSKVLIDLHVPKNRPTYAIALAHAWQYLRNVLRTKDYPSINYWMATSAKENFFYCDCDAEWDPILTNSPKISNPSACKNPGDATDGCFHMEGANNGSGYGMLMQYYHGRFPKGGHAYLISGGNFETAALLKAYYDIVSGRLIQYVWGCNPYDLLNKTKDPYAFDRILAFMYNRGRYTAENGIKQTFDPGALRPQFEQSNCWEQVPGYPLEGHAGYTMQISKAIAVLSNNMSYPTVNSDCKFGGFYDQEISWDLMNSYMDKLFVLYKEQDKDKIKAIVKKKFDSIKGGQPLSFRYEFGPVLDAFIIALPKEDPMFTSLHGDTDPGCIGNDAPASHIETKGPLEVCEGISVELVAVIDNGGDGNDTYKWYKDGVLMQDETDRILTVTETGVYKLEVCNSLGHCAPACCEIEIKVKKCSDCNMTAKATSKNANCKGTKDGTIEVDVNGATDFTIIYTGPVNGSTNKNIIENVPNGRYNIVVVDNNNPDCKAYTNIEVGYDVEINDLVEATSTSTDCDKANLEAKIIPQPAPCNYTVVYRSVDGGWETHVNADITTSSGGGGIYQIPKGGWDPDGDTISLKVFDGDIITSSLTLMSLPADKKNEVKYQIEIIDGDNNSVATYDVPIGTVSQGTSKELGKVTVKCPHDPPTYTFEWDPTDGLTNPNEATTDATVTKSTIYTVIAYHPDYPQCKLTDTALVKFTCDGNCNPASNIKIEPENASVCEGGNITFKLESFDGIALDKYYFTWFDNNGDPIPGKIKLEEGSIGYNTYSITGITNANAGTYKLRIQDGKEDDSGCLAEKEFTLETGGGISLIINDPDPVCEPETIDLSNPEVTKGSSSIDKLTYWKDPAGTIPLNNYETVDESGTYYIMAEGTDGSCVVLKPVTVVINELPIAEIENTEEELEYCVGENGLTLVAKDAGSDAKYEWIGPVSGNEKTLPNATKGTYTLQVIIGSCRSEIITIEVKEIKDFTIVVEDKIDVCKGMDLTLKVNNIKDAKYEWNGPNGFNSEDQNPVIPNAQEINSGTYIITVTAVGCDGNTYTKKDSTEVKVMDEPELVINTDSPIEFCPGDDIKLSVNEVDGATYSWTGPANFSSSERNPRINNSTKQNAGIYIVKVTIPGCKDGSIIEAQDSVVANLKITSYDMDLESNGPLCISDTLVITATEIDSFKYNWKLQNGTIYEDHESRLIVHSLKKTDFGEYILFTGSECPGEVLEWKILIIEDEECDYGKIFVPNAFSPNNDNNNDILLVYGESIVEMEFKVFDRWGQIVFLSTDREQGWDGTFKGKDLDNGVFSYTLKARLSTGTSKYLRGNITLVR